MKKKICICIVGVSSSRNEENKCVKNQKKKKKCSRIGWAIAQLCHNTMGNCIVTQHLWACCRFLSVSQYNHCIVTGATYMTGEVCCDTQGCIVTEREGWLGWNLCCNTR